ncbi:MAG: hypothetical protein HZC02_01955 [Candidatus Levybacteria bacterium]|nr:hypothetical protein [Candidatus Levybacteria bacterium]
MIRYVAKVDPEAYILMLFASFYGWSKIAPELAFDALNIFCLMFIVLIAIGLGLSVLRMILFMPIEEPDVIVIDDLAIMVGIRNALLTFVLMVATAIVATHESETIRLLDRIFWTLLRQK